MIGTDISVNDSFFRKMNVTLSDIDAETIYLEGSFNCNGEGSIVLQQKNNGRNEIEGLVPDKYEFRIALDQYGFVRGGQSRSGLFRLSIWLDAMHHDPDRSQFSCIFDDGIMDIRVAVPKSTVSVDILTESNVSILYSRRSSQATYDLVEFVVSGVSGYAFEIDHRRYPAEGYYRAVKKINSDHRSKIMYHIFPDRFFRSGPDSPDLQRWGERPKRDSFFGGNLEGIRQKLSYIRDLHVDHIYLNPIFKSKSNHRYDVDDYYSIDEMLGTDQDLKNLVSDAHDHGMKVILDMVFNHTSTDFPFFRDVLKNGRNSPYYHWYIFHRDEFIVFRGRGKRGSYPPYETFMGYGGMPKLDHRNPEVRRYCMDVLKYYIEKFNIDGFRYDVAHSIYGKFFEEVMAEIGKNKLHIGEAWCLPTYLVNATDWQSYTNYFLGSAILDMVKGTITAGEFYDRIQRMIMVNGIEKQQNMMNVLDSHDTPRILRMLHGDRKKVKLAYSILYIIDGIATVYYGDEAGLDGGRDPDDRRCFPWGSIDEDMRKFFVEMGNLRERLNLGSAGVVAVNEDGSSFVVKKIKADLSVAVHVAKNDRMPFPQDHVIAVREDEAKTSPWDFYITVDAA
ncbi:glycoside hydrolase family 13 protein [Thermoplasma sp.]|uniref:glycoside hydrolase family 13 protein n=1 Tax=Thermoplasma sp. TaxID=1973142 RepID=UPI001286F991|nr:glycoside hydrolase family 13 protein [Thermoplasma sp.]KAA8921920.1 MAG: glycoside hydrolase family 13 protein [Thermoplasma sp.]